MVTRFSNARVQAALSVPTGYRRRSRFTFSRGGVDQVLEPISGSFTQDARRNGRWDGRLSFLGDDIAPSNPRDLLAPFGTTLTAELGLELVDGTTAYVGYGKYDLDSTSVEISPDERTVSVGLIDLSDRVDRYRFETPFTLVAGSTLSLAIRAVIRNRTGFDPGLTTVPIQLGAARVMGLETGTGPWEELLDILASFGLTMFYRRDGMIQVINPNPFAITPYALTSPVSLSADFDSRPANVVVARGESTDDATPPVQAVAMDTDPGSPTYAGTGPGTSPYGRRTEFYSSPLLLTTANAQTAAQSILAENLGAGATYVLTMPYDPTVDAGDVISFGGFTYVIDKVTVDLTGETSASARRLS